MTNRIREKCLSAFFMLLCAGWALCAAFPATAEVVEIDRAKLFALPVADEDVALTFLKMTGVRNPEFDKLVKRTEQYRNKEERDRSGFLDSEEARLQAKYLAMRPETDRLIIRVEVKVYFIDAPQGRQAKLEIKFPSKGLIYFPFYYGGIPVAVLPNGIEDFQTLLLSETEKDIAAATLDPVPEATLVLELKPVSADLNNPLVLDGEKQFPLLCDIEYIGIHNRNTDQVWAWSPEGKIRKETIYDFKQ